RLHARTLHPYTTLFRSGRCVDARDGADHGLAGREVFAGHEHERGLRVGPGQALGHLRGELAHLAQEAMAQRLWLEQAEPGAHRQRVVGPDGTDEDLAPIGEPDFIVPRRESVSSGHWVGMLPCWK